MPSEYSTCPSSPGNWLGLDAGTCDSPTGNVIGRWPPGSTRPNRTLASAVPLLSPGYHASTTEATWLIHGMTTGAPASIPTTVRGFAASDSVSSETTTTAVLAALAAATARAMPGARSDGIAQLRLVAASPPDTRSG